MAGESLIIGNGNWGVKSGNLLGYNLNGGNYVPRELTFTRATTGTRTNGALLVEEVPYNLAQYSEQFDNAYWIKSDAIIIPNAIASPSGLVNAEKLIGSASTSQKAIYINLAISGTNTFSCYFKAAEFSTGCLKLSGAISANFDLIAGTVTAQINCTASIQSADNGWWRCSITTTSTPAYAWIAIDSGNTVGNGSSGIYIWGAQLVAGSSPLTYLPTTTRLNIPRIDYSTGTAALLMEPQRTNIVLRSEEFDSASWAKSGATVIANDTTAPNGLPVADRITQSGAAINFSQSISLPAGVVTFTTYVKKGNFDSSSGFLFGFFSTVSGDVGYINFNFATGTTSVYSGTFISHSATNVGNGWYRIQGTINVPSAGTGYFYNGAIGLSIAGVGSYYYSWGAQVEAGTYATSYIPTTSASVTRNIDTLIQSGISNFIGQTQGTIFFDVRIGESDSSSSVRLLGGISDGTLSNRIEIYRFNNTIQTDGVVGGAFQFGANVFAITNFNTNLKIAISYSLNNVNTFVNGVLVSTDTTALIPACSRLTVGCDRSGSSSYGGLINQVSLFPNPLSNAELAILTTK